MEQIQKIDLGEKIEHLSYLIQRFGKGYSVDNLERMRKFYLIYSNSATPLRNSKNMQITSVKSNRKENSATLLRNSQTPFGKLHLYVNYYDRFVKTEEENPTIGILLCTDKSDAMVEITLPKDNNQIFASKYQTYLPSKEELQKLIEENISK